MTTPVDIRTQELRPIKGSALPNLFVDVNGQTKSTLTNANIAPVLKTAEQMLSFSEGLTRNVNAATANNLFASGELEADHVRLEMLRTDVITYLEQMMAGGTSLPKITVYRTEIIGGKMVITDQYLYENCFVTSMDSKMGQSGDTTQGAFRDSAFFGFRYLKRTHTINIYDETGASKGSKVSTIDFQTGELGGASA
jgi:type VI protein secretion system component Hcp